MAGWIKLHRSIKDWEWYDDVNVRLTFLHCLVEANFKDQSYKGVEIKRGSFPCGRIKFSKEVGITVQQLRTALSKLESTGEINQRSTSKGTIITVCNYESYQGEATSDQPAIQQTDNKPITNHQPLTKKVKSEKGKNSNTKANFIPPTKDDFTTYMKTALPAINPEWSDEQITRACHLQFETYTEQDWHTGGNNPRKIGNWKMTAKNSMKHLKPWNFGQSQKNTPSHHSASYVDPTKPRMS